MYTITVASNREYKLFALLMEKDKVVGFPFFFGFRLKNGFLRMKYEKDSSFIPWTCLF